MFNIFYFKSKMNIQQIYALLNKTEEVPFHE